MTQTATRPTDAPGPSSITIPPSMGVQGPRMRVRWYRNMAIYVTVVVLGLLPAWVGLGPSWRAFGLGLIWPGAGFLYTSDVVLLVLTVVAVASVLKKTLLAGALSWVAAIWLLAAVGAAWRAPSGVWSWATWVVPMLPVAGLMALFVRTRLLRSRQRRIGAERNEWLAHTTYRVPGTVEPDVGELDTDQLAWQRHGLDLALQPVDSFDGFVTRSQVDDSAYRYQFAFLQYALAVSQRCNTPAFDGYLSLAQRNLIEKMCDKRVWEYWRHENLWGNLDANPDPVRRDNVMYSGYWSLMLETYRSNTGDERYERPNSLPLHWSDDRVFEYDAGRVAESVGVNLESRNGWGMFPCEPGNVFAGCNSFPQDARLARGRNEGGAPGTAGADAFRTLLDEEMTAPDGSLLLALHPRLGIANTMLRSAYADAGVAYFLRPVVPEAAARTWEILRHDVVSVVDGTVTIAATGLDKWIGGVDPGNGDKSGAYGKILFALLATEMGDREVANGLLAMAEDADPPVTTDGRRSHPHVSNIGNAKALTSRLSRRDGWYDLIATGMPEHWLTGPVLAEVPYPEVLVARAVSDGSDLSLVLHPGGEGGRRRLRLGRLRPHATYNITGATERAVTSGPNGSAEITVDLGARHEVNVLPSA